MIVRNTDHGESVPAYGYRFRSPHLNHFDSVRSELNRRLQQEVEELERRISTLRQTRSPGSETIIDTYERMIANKQRFLMDMER